MEFLNDDSGYFAWIAVNQDGLVLNVRSKPDPEYVILHRADCGSISNKNHLPGAFTGRGYRKICATDLDELRAAAKREGRDDGSFSKRCGLCQP